MALLRTGIVGAGTLLGRELKDALQERRFPAPEPLLLDAPTAENAPIGQRKLVAMEDEAAVLEPFGAERLADLELLFLAAAPEASCQAAAAAPAMTRLVDLSGGLASEAAAALAGFEAPPRARVTVVAHPAAQTLALLLGCLIPAGIKLATATVFEPVSQRGLEGVRELEQQTVRMLAAQDLPRTVHDAQVAFNLLARLGPAATPKLSEIRRRVAGETTALLAASGGSEVPLAIEVLQAPLFHATVISLFIQLQGEPDAQAVAGLLKSPWLAPSAEYPDVVAAAGTDTIQLGPVRPAPGVSGGTWLFATLDNLRRTAYSAVDAALAGLSGGGA